MSHLSTQNQEWIRPSQATLFGLSRSTLYRLAADGIIQTRSIVRPGCKFGARLFSAQSIRKAIEEAK